MTMKLLILYATLCFSLAENEISFKERWGHFREKCRRKCQSDMCYCIMRNNDVSLMVLDIGKPQANSQAATTPAYGFKRKHHSKTDQAGGIDSLVDKLTKLQGNKQLNRVKQQCPNQMKPGILIGTWGLRSRKKDIYMYYEKMSWEMANSCCQDIRGRLFVVTPDETMKYLKDLLKRYYTVCIDGAWVGSSRYGSDRRPGCVMLREGRLLTMLPVANHMSSCVREMCCGSHNYQKGQ